MGDFGEENGLYTAAEVRAATRRLMANPRRTLAASKKGSLVDVEVIALNIDKVPPHLHFDLFSTFLKNISEKLPASLVSTREKTIRGNLVLSCLAGIVSMHESSLLVSQEFHSELSFSSQNVLDWISHFDSAPMADEDPALRRVIEERSIIPRVLIAFGDCSTNGTHLLHDDNTFRLAAARWFMEDPEDGQYPYAARALTKCCEAQDDKMKAVGLMFERYCLFAVTRKVVADLKTVLKLATPESMDHVAVCVELLCALTVRMKEDVHYQIRGFRGILLGSSGRGAVSLTKALTRLSTETLDPPSFAYTVRERLFDFVNRDLFTAPVSVRNIVHSIRFGLLDAMLDVCVSKSDGTQRQTLQDRLVQLLHSLTAALCFSPVVRAAAKAVTILPYSEEEVRYLTEVDLIGAHWDRFERTVLERLAVGAIQAREIALHGKILRCSNPACDTTGPSTSFWRCARCKVAAYCSAECQALAWQDGRHKGECKHLAKVMRKTLVHLSYRDRQFLNRLSTIDVLRHLPTLRKKAADEYPDLPFGHVGYYVSYMNVPPTFSVESIPCCIACKNEACRAEDPLRWHVSQDVLDRVARGQQGALMIGYQYVANGQTWFTEHSPVLTERELAVFLGEAESTASRVEGSKREAGVAVPTMTSMDAESRYDVVDEVLHRARELALGALPAPSAEPCDVHYPTSRAIQTKIVEAVSEAIVHVPTKSLCITGG